MSWYRTSLGTTNYLHEYGFTDHDKANVQCLFITQEIIYFKLSEIFKITDFSISRVGYIVINYTVNFRPVQTTA